MKERETSTIRSDSALSVIESIISEHNFCLDNIGLYLDGLSSQKISNLCLSIKDNLPLKEAIEKYIIDNLDYLISGNIENIYYLFACFEPDSKYNNYLTDYLLINIASILEGLSVQRIAYFVSCAKEILPLKEAIEKYIIDNLDDLISGSIINAYDLLIYFDPNSKYYNNISTYLKNNISVFLDNTSFDASIFEIKNQWEKFPEFMPIFKQYFEDHFDELVDRMYYSATKNFHSFKYNQSDFKEQRKAVKEVLKLLIKELCEKEHVDIGDIRFIGSGGYSTVYQINNKVLKLGMLRATKLIPDNPYMIKPLLRKSFSIDGKEIGEQLFVEVTERVAQLSNNLSQDKIMEIMYCLYSKQRALGIEWFDIKPENVGVLLKDNGIHWPSELHSDCKQLGLIPIKHDIKLKTGEYVLLDADYLFTQEDFHRSHPDIDDEIESGFIMSNNSYWVNFYLRYNEEHNRKIH